MQSAYAEELAVRIARSNGSAITGVHAYSGRFHRHRFRVLEDHLPEQYRKEEIIDHQRSVHSVLIGRGLELISLEYMKRLRDRCADAHIAFSEIISDGKNADVIIGASGKTGLMVMGAEGLGSTGGAHRIGSNTRRMLRFGSCDLLIARHGGPVRTILAAVDGSDEAYRMVEKAADLALSLGAGLTIVSSFDPGLHKTVFSGLSGVLSESAGEVFRFSEQETLHNEIIDRSLARLYGDYLENARLLAKKKGVNAITALLQGKPYREVCAKAAGTAADLIVVARHGMHRGTFGDIGSNAENIAEHAETSVLVVTETPAGRATGPGTVQESRPSGPLPEDIRWSDEAGKRLERVPAFARPMAIIAIERFAAENGYGEITPEIMDRAREKMGI